VFGELRSYSSLLLSTACIIYDILCVRSRLIEIRLLCDEDITFILDHLCER